MHPSKPHRKTGHSSQSEPHYHCEALDYISTYTNIRSERRKDVIYQLLHTENREHNLYLKYSKLSECKEKKRERQKREREKE